MPRFASSKPNYCTRLQNAHLLNHPNNTLSITFIQTCCAYVVQNTYLKRVLQKNPIEQNQFIQFFLCKETFSTELVSRVSGF